MKTACSDRRLFRATTIVLVSLVAFALFLPVAGSAQTDDPDIRVGVDIAEIREGGRATLTFELLDSPPLESDKVVYLAIGGSAEVGSQADFTLTASNGTTLPSIGNTLYNRTVTIPAGRTSVTARINVRNDRDAEQCEIIKIEALTRESTPRRFLGILNLSIPANDLDRPRTVLLPSVSVPSLYPEVGVELAATFDDPDDGRRFSQKWTWERSSRPDGPWTILVEQATYTPRAADVGQYLRVEVRYENSDWQPSCAHVISEGRVQGDSGNGSNNPPEFGSGLVERQVSENAPMDSRVGAPVTATDRDNDPLTYSLKGPDANLFRIDPKTGQIMTNGESLDTDGHTVTVTATDPSLASTSVTVSIQVTEGTTDPINNGGGNNNNGGGNSGGNSGRGNNEGSGNNADSTDGGEGNQPTPGGFTDLDSTGEHVEAVKRLAEEEVLDGTGCKEGLLCPGGPVLRWEAAVWFVRVLDRTNPDPVSSLRFTDVDPTVWWAPYVERLADIGITVGCTDDPAQYCPDVKITRAQMATMLTKAFDLPPSGPVGFMDISRTIHAPRIDASYAAGITSSCTADPLRFCPLDYNTRAEFAAYLIRGRIFVATRGT